MKSKNILHAAAFVAAFGLSAASARLFAPAAPPTEVVSTYAVPSGSDYQPTSCFKRRDASPVAAKINAFVKQDDRNGRVTGSQRQAGEENIFASSDQTAVGDYASAVNNYVAASERLRADDLPADFQTDWRTHLQAWRDYSEFLDRMENSANRAALSAEELTQIDRFHSREISETFEKVLETGAAYGADIE